MRFSVKTLVRHAAAAIIVCALLGVSDTPRVPSEEAYVLSDMWETYRSLIRQRDRLLRERELLDLEKGLASSDSLYVVLDLRARKAFVKIHGVMLKEISLLSVDIENRPEGERVREFVFRGRAQRSGEEDLTPADTSAGSGEDETDPERSFWDLCFDPGLVIRVTVQESSSRFARIAHSLKVLARRMTLAMETSLPFGRPVEGNRIRLRMGHEDARTILGSVPVGSRLIVVP